MVSAFNAFLLIIPCCSCSAVHEVPALICFRRFITMFTRARHWSLSGSSWNRPQKYVICLRSILILSPRGGLSFVSGLLTLGFLTKIVCALLIRVSKSRKLLSLSWNTFQRIHVFMGSHLSYLSFLFYCCTVLHILMSILLNLTQFRQFCLSDSGWTGHTHTGISALHRRAAYWLMWESGLLLSDAANAALLLIGFLRDAVRHWTGPDAK